MNYSSLFLTRCIVVLLCIAALFTTLPHSCSAQGEGPFYNTGVDLFGKGDYEGAARFFEMQIAERPTYTDAHFNLGITYATLKRFDKAIVQFTWVIDKMPPTSKVKRADAFHERGRSYSDLKQTDKALSDFGDALLIKPEMTEVLLDRAATYYQLKQYNEAIADYTAYLAKVKTPDASVFRNRAECYRLTEKYDAALADEEQAFTTQPNFETAMVVVGDCDVAYHRSKQCFSSAELYYNKFAAYCDHAIVLPKTTNGQKARAYYAKAHACEMRIAVPNAGRAMITEAIASYALYLTSLPDAKDAATVRARIADLQKKRDGMRQSN